MTVLNDEDINLHGISVRSLKRAGRVIGGISGFMSICIVEDVCGDFFYPLVKHYGFWRAFDEKG